MKTLLPIIAFVSIVSALRCPSQWSMHESNCYRYFSQPKPFWDAVNFCRKQLFYAKNKERRYYSDLVSIHGHSENSFVSSLGAVGTNFFIGLYHNINEDRRTWHWTDKTLLDYTNWAPGQPDFSHQNFGVMWNGHTPKKWDDADWYNGLSFVCKAPADDCLTLPDEEIEFCRNQLGVEDGTIRLTSSSEWNTKHGPSRGRLNTTPRNGMIGAWAARFNDQNQWIQADIGALKEVTGVITQGRNGCCDQWVTSYEVLYSTDGNNFFGVIGSNQDTAVFVGNTNPDTQVTNLFATPVHARYIRIHPLTWNNHISLRFEILGCQDEDASGNGEICENGGTLKDRRCVCQKPYECIDCSWYNGCSSNPCQNGGRCINHDHRYSCECDEGLTGDHCEKYEECPCDNNGTCTKDHENTFHICVCPEDYTGVTCQTYIGHCKANPCENGGSCHSISASPFYICQCKSPYIGSRCTTTIYDCISNPCLNNGTCIPNAENDGASCLCPSDYTGSTCGFLKQTSSAVYSDTSNAGLKTAFITVTAVMSITIILLISYVYSIKRQSKMPADLAFVGFNNGE